MVNLDNALKTRNNEQISQWTCLEVDGRGIVLCILDTVGRSLHLKSHEEGELLLRDTCPIQTLPLSRGLIHDPPKNKNKNKI
jgi:hypothetical protein